ncbi:MAG: ATP-binding protein [Gemmatimonadaceae bacterium]|nr:ATP-binding protein [Gemmatimonadaceae bacterium]
MLRDNEPYRPRLAERHLTAVLGIQPVAVIMGARQTGKSTLVSHADATRHFTQLTLDDLATREQALRDPEGLVARGDHLVIDEVQRAPELLVAIKRAVDRDRRPGRFVLTGSANLLSMRRVQESLAGRASYISLWPLTRRERAGDGSAGRWDLLFDAAPHAWRDLLDAAGGQPDDWTALAARTAYVPLALGAATRDQQADWLQGYIDALVARDIPALSAIDRPFDLLRLMRAACTAIGQVEHQAAWAQTTGLPTSTVSRWLDLLSMTFQLIRVPAYSVNRTSRLTHRPRLYWSDTAMALHLSGSPAPTGAHLENLVLQDLLAWSQARSQRPMIHHWRTAATQREVDFVVEQPDGRVLAIEVKATRSPGVGDTAGLRAFLAEYADIAVGGLLLHGGHDTMTLGEKVVAVPWWRVL